MSRIALRTIVLDGPIGLVPLTRGYVAKIDAADIDCARHFNWRAVVRRHTVYASTTVVSAGVARDMFLHRALLMPPAHLEVDHIDGDGLNNTRANLRACSKSENLRNSRRRRRLADLAKGVKLRDGRYFARIFIGSREVHLGAYDTPQEAAAAYYGAALIASGPFARRD